MKGFWIFAIGAIVGAALASLPKAAARLHSAIAFGSANSGKPQLHTEERFSFLANAPLERVAPLFGAEKEKLWAPDWNPQFIYPLPANDQQGMVFAVQHGHLRSVWVNTQFDLKNGQVQYAYVIPDALVTLITLKLIPEGNQTKVQVEYDRTALSAETEPHVQHLAEQDRKSGPEWEAQINDYLDKNKAVGNAPR